MRSGPREIVFIVLLIVIPLGAWRYVIQPRNTHAEQIHRAIEAKQDELKALDRTKATIGDLKKEIAQLSEAMAFFQSKLPNEKEIDKVLHSLWQLAKSNELVTKGIRTKDRKKPSETSLTSSQHCDQPIAMQLEGNFTKFYTFCQDLEDQPRIMRVSEMKISQAADAPEGFIQVELTMSVFFEADDGQGP